MKPTPQPYCSDSERAIIGCCLGEPVQCLPESQIIITSPEYFYDLRCRTVWETLCALALNEINPITISATLKNRSLLDQVGGVAFLNECQDLVPSAAQLPVWLRTIEEKFTRRRLIESAREIEASAFSGMEITAVLDASERSILSVRPNQRTVSDIKNLTNQAIAKMEAYMVANGSLLGMTTGLTDLDRLTDGIHGGEMVVLAGYTSTGKTALAVNVATANAILGIPVAIFTAEMLPVQIVIRQLCSVAKANWKRLYESDAPRLTDAASKISKSPIHIEPASGMTAGQVMATSRRLKQKHGIKIIVVDYIQLLSGVGDNREQQIASISKVMKAMSLELDCAVIALSQLTDDGKLRESRAIGHDADSVWKLENDGDWKPREQPIKLNVEKCRDGETGVVPLMFLKEFTKMECRTKEAYDH